MSWSNLELDVIRWAEERHIIPNSTPMAQAIKTHEELGELLSALHRGVPHEIEDAYGDILVTLIICAELANVDLTECLRTAYDEIKDRKGYLRSDGVFVKEAA
jgi:uncharacterized protein YabN with tetrapyrrole methylase and pyrophosphatase domain